MAPGSHLGVTVAKRRNLFLLISFVMAVLASLLVPTAANAAVETVTACGVFDPKANQLIVKIRNIAPMENGRVTTATATTTAGQTSSGVQSLVVNPANGDFTMEVVIPGATVNAGKYQLFAIWDGRASSEDVMDNGSFGQCPGSPPINPPSATPGGTNPAADYAVCVAGTVRVVLELKGSVKHLKMLKMLKPLKNADKLRKEAVKNMIKTVWGELVGLLVDEKVKSACVRFINS